MNFNDIDHVLFEEILLGEGDAPVRVQVETFLAGLRDTEENMAAVYECARQIAKARWWELKVWQDGDMETIVAIFDAMLDPMIQWLDENGLVNARAHIFGKAAGRAR
jgi:hypothetical protein